MPARMSTKTWVSRPWRVRTRSCAEVASPSRFSHASTSWRDDCPPAPEYFISSTEALVAAFSSASWSMRACASRVIASSDFSVSFWVMNFWMTSLTSPTPVASLILRNAASYADTTCGQGRRASKAVRP